MHLRELALAATLAAAASCGDEDTGPQPLLGAHGSVEFAHDPDPGALQPAVVFVSTERNALHIVDADGEGQLPKRFQIALWDPPPDDAMAEFVAPDSKATSLAIGFIAAVAEDHPEFAPRLSWHFTTTQNFPEGCEGEACTCGADGCLRSERFCIGDAEEDCYEHAFRCPDPYVPLDACMLTESEGDPDIARQPWVSVQGLSQNYLILYLKQEAAAESFLAAAFGARQHLSAGYHLIERHSMTKAERASAKACQARAERLATDRYNSTFHESATLDELKNSTGNLFDTLLTRALFELECPLTDEVMTPVSDPGTTPISVRLAREIRTPLTSHR